jgi:RNA polymerase sigma-70 factor (ECF subfamily)
MSNSFETIVSEHYEPLFRFAMSLTRCEPDAMDLTQHTFYVWAKNSHQLRDPSKAKSWLYTTLHRAFLQSQRRRVRFPHSALEEADLPAAPPVTLERLDSPALLAALEKIDKIFQTVVALFYLEDYSYKDIAAVLELPVGTVKSRLVRGVAQLKKILYPRIRTRSPPRPEPRRFRTSLP